MKVRIFRRIAVWTVFLTLLWGLLPPAGGVIRTASAEESGSLTIQASLYPKLEWTEDAGASQYRLTVQRQGEATPEAVYTLPAGVRSLALPNRLQPGATYDLTVESGSAGSWTAWAEDSLATPADREQLVSDAFEDDAVGTLPAGFTKYTPDANNTVQVVADGTQHRIELNRSVGSAVYGPAFTYPFGAPLTDGIVSAEFSVKRSSTQRFILYSLGYSLTRSQNAAWAFVDYNRHYLNDPTYRDVGAMNADTWYHYKLVADIDAGTYDFYINGVKANAAPVAFQATQPIREFTVYNSAGRGGGDLAYQTGPYWVDDVTIRHSRTPPRAVAPASGASQLGLTETLQWQDSGAEDYSIVIARDAAMTDIAWSGAAAGTADSLSIPAAAGLDYDTTYYWRVVAHDDGWSWSADTASFKTMKDPAGPQDVSRYPSLTWTAVPGSDAYTVSIASVDGTPQSYAYNGIAGTQFTVPFALDASRSYSWRVLADDGVTEAGSGLWRTEADDSVWVSEDFETAATGSVPAPFAAFAPGTVSTVQVVEAGGERYVELNRSTGSTDAGPALIYPFGRTVASGTLDASFRVRRDATQRFLTYAMGNNLTYNQQPVWAFVDYGNVYATDPTYRSQGKMDADKWYDYRMVVDVDAGTYDLYIDGQKTNQQPIAFQGANPLTQFMVFNKYGRGGADNGYHTGAYDVDDVTVAWQPTSPSAVGPVDRSEDTSVTPAFEWRDAHADSYTLVIGRDSGLTEVTQVIDGITDNAYTLPASAALDYDTVYYWKVVAHKGADSWSGGSAARLTTQLDASGNRMPVLFSAAPTEAKPGEMFQLFGASFDTDDVRLLRLDDTPAAGLEALIGAAADPEALDRDEAAAIGEPYGNDTALRAVVPAAETPGMYAVWAVNDTQWSAPKLLNKTTVYFASPNRLNTASSREVRIIGKQLAGDSNAAYVYLVDEEGDATAVTLEEAGPYELVFEWPLALGPGTYEIWTHNGYGGAYGWGETQTIEVVDEPFSTYSVSIATYGAIPDDGLDDRAAIQAALDAADGSGGGTVLVPAGTYDISNTLHVGEHTALKGLGKDAGGEHQSVIKFITGDPVGPSTGGIGKAIVRVGPGSGVEDLKLVGSVSVDMGIDVEDGADDVFIRNNEVRNYFPTSGIKGYYSGVSGSSGTTDYFERLQIVGNTFEGYNGINFDLSEYGRFIDNTVLTRRYTPIAFTSSSKNIIEGNTIDGRNASGVREASRGITFNTGFDRPGLKPNEMNYVSDNNITYVGNQAAPTNDGEYVLFDNNGDAPFPNTHYYGAVADGTPESLTFANVSWTANQMKELYVLVVDGRGLGQYRKVTGSSGGTIYVDKPWVVTPDYRSKAVVARFHTLNLVVGNHAYLNKGNNFVLWGNVLDNIVDGNEAEQGGSTVSALDHSSHPSQYGAAYYNLIQNADSPEAAITYSEYGYGSTARASVISYGNTLRRNDTDRLSFRTNSVQSASGSVQANLLEHNKVGSAIVVTPNARNNVLRENAVSGAWPLVADGGESTIVIERGLLPAPSEVSVIPAVYGVQLNWSAVTGADGYYVFRKLHGAATAAYERLDTGTGAGPLAATSWLDAEAAVGELYDYRVAAYADGFGQGHAGQPQAGFSGAITATSLTAAEWQWTAPYDGEVEALASLRKLDGSDYGFELRVNGNPAVGASVLTSVYQAHERISLQAGDELTFVWTSADPAADVQAHYGVLFTRDAPIPLAPQQGSHDVVTDGAAFSWTDVPSAESYRLLIGTDPALTSPTFVYEDIATNSFTMPAADGLDELTTYYWKVQAVDGSDVWERADAVQQIRTAPYGRELLYAQNFNALSGLPSAWTVRTGTTSSIGIAEVPGRFNRSLVIASEGQQDAPRLTIPLPSTLDSGKVHLSWDVMHTGNQTAHFQLFPAKAPVTASGLSGLFSAYGYYYVDWSPASTYPSLLNQWRHIDMLLDLDTNQYTVDIDGVRLKLNNGTEVFTYAPGAIDTLVLQFSSDRWPAVVYFDNIAIMAVEE
ncbi:right-handed parallel beta-helix repeat-containing protein [Cohnella ginsengisoli]|uniref:Right-handed parallel beta-helix repeat-containing protein n=1 Tax=Cohnella ginsengisoli TaxID=425004 RepID=A0A9X4KHZ5_9BACL|nr:right-handed parallel beta-helix repeat-containing protein [Cohnella ginsengisoli]MDG0792340.1 right-handed parallel beta-helix repeat-containing protein [Cohnella ginsengisoli]